LVKFAKKIEKFVGRILSNIRFEVKDMNVRSARREYKFVKIKSNISKEGEIGLGIGKVGKFGKVSTPPEYTLKEIVGIGKTLPNLPTLPTAKKHKKPKSDRELQFFEAPECKNIVPNHTVDDLFFWLKDHPGKKAEEIYERFGLGSLKFRNQLIEEDKIIKEGDRYFVK